jgi:hypothetical protein
MRDVSERALAASRTDPSCAKRITRWAASFYVGKLVESRQHFDASLAA